VKIIICENKKLLSSMPVKLKEKMKTGGGKNSVK
jgi:hypothetical protein